MDTLPGATLHLPLVAEVGGTRSHVPRCVTWHSHPGGQLLFLLRGTTAYEFKHRGRAEVEVPGGHFLIIPPGVAHRGAPDMRPPCILFHIGLAEAQQQPRIAFGAGGKSALDERDDHLEKVSLLADAEVGRVIAKPRQVAEGRIGDDDVQLVGEVEHGQPRARRNLVRCADIDFGRARL